jgi:rare lipoprotein A
LAGLGLLCAFPATADNISTHYSTTGFASWYGRELQGHRTSNGERFDLKSITAANKSLPLPCYARVTNLRNGASMIVRVNDRGPFVRGRIVDVSQRVADLLDIRRFGVAKVRVDYVGKAAPAGSDENFLLASLNSADQPPDGVVAVARTAYAPEPRVAAPALAALNVAVAPPAAAPASPFGDLAHSPFLEAEVASR